MYLLRKSAEGSWLRRKTGWNTIARLLNWLKNEREERRKKRTKR
jgi:hypothetical protein